MSLLLAAQRALTVPGWAKDELSRKAQATPSLDLRFADNKSLVDATTGQNLVSFTRASSGTYVDSQGVIRTATTNLLLRSEDLSASPWTKSAPVTITADSSQGQPFSGAQVFRIVYSTSNEIVNQSFTGISGVDYTGSLYIKGTAGDTIRFGGTAISGASNVTLTGQWQRIVFTGVSSSTSLAVVVSTFGGATARTIYVTGAQLEQSSTVGEYIPTTSTINSAPRFDHNPTTGESLGLLVEESRTNLFPSSIYTANANGWTNGIIGGTGTIASASVTNKAGNTNGVFNVSGLDGSSYVGCFVSTASSTNTYTASVFIKNNGGTFFQLRLVNQTGGTFKSSGTQYTFATGTWQDGVAGTAAPISRSVQDMGDGWFRFSITAADNGTGNTQTSLLLFGGSTTTNYNFYLWGAQLEAGAFPTSYIPTTTATATRSADVASISGSNFSSWYRQDEGTVYFSTKTSFAVPIGPFPRVVQIQGATGNDRIEQSFYSGGQVVYIRTTTGVQAEWYPGYLAQNGATSSLAFAANSAAGSTNGAITGTDNVITVPAVDRMQIGAETASTNFLNGTIRRLTYWPQRLSNSTLQSITQ